MMKKFIAYNEALAFNTDCSAAHGPKHLKVQLLRAASSIALNLAEGSCQPSGKNRARYYRMALGSLRETQAALIMMAASASLIKKADNLGALIYRLCKATEARANIED